MFFLVLVFLVLRRYARSQCLCTRSGLRVDIYGMLSAPFSYCAARVTLEIRKQKEGWKLMFFGLSHLIRFPPLHTITKHIVAVKATTDNQESTRKTVVKVGGFLFRRRTPGCLPRMSKIAKMCHIVKLKLN